MPQSTLQYHKVQRTIYRSRLINLPKNVVDADGVHKAYLDDDVFAKYGKTAIGRSFFKSAEKIESSDGHGEFSYIIFMSDDICDMIRRLHFCHAGIRCYAKNAMMSMSSSKLICFMMKSATREEVRRPFRVLYAERRLIISC